MNFKRIAALLCAAVLTAGVLGGCTPKKAVEASAESKVSMRNDGRETKLVVAQLGNNETRTSILREIADKYEADFPKTKIEIRTVEDAQALEKLLNSDEKADLVEVYGAAQPEYVEKGLLLDIYPYIRAWEENATLTAAADQAVGSMGMEHAYLIPNSFTQEILFYRMDWFDAYNLAHPDEPQARARTWKEIADAAGYLSDKGGLAIAGKERLVDYFDAMVWSSISVGRLADPAAAYFSPLEAGTTIFTTKTKIDGEGADLYQSLREKTAEGADQFLSLLQKAVPEEALNWGEEEALNAFLEGETAMLLADHTTLPVIRSAMEEGTWAVQAFPRGLTGSAVFRDEFTGWGISAKTENAEIAAHFLTFLSNGDNNTYLAKQCGEIPIHLSASDLEESLLQSDLSVNMEMIKRADWYQLASEPIMYRAYSGYREQANAALRDFVQGSKSREELFAFIDGYWSKAYQEEGNKWGS